MTVETTHSKNTFTGNGSQTVYAFTFRAWETTEIVVLVNNATASPTVALNSSGIGGTVTFSSPPALDAEIIIKRAVEQKQPSTFPLRAKLDTTELEELLDRMVGMTQDNARDLLSNTFNWRGTWSATETYQIGDAVYWSGTTYRAVVEHSNQEPPDSDYWSIVALKGDSGGLSWQGTWDSVTSYAVGDGVTHEGTSYICTATSTNNEPPNVSYWDVLAEAGEDGEVSGPASSVDGRPALFDGTSGNLLKQLAYSFPAALGGADTYLKSNGSVASWAALATGGVFRPTLITETLRTLPTSGSVSGVYVMKDVDWVSTGSLTLAGPTIILMNGGSFTLSSGHTITGTALVRGGKSVASNYAKGGNGGGPGAGEGGGSNQGGSGAGGPGGTDGGYSGYYTSGSYGAPPGVGYPRLMCRTGSGGGGGMPTASVAGGTGGKGGTYLIVETYDCDVTLNENVTTAGEAGEDKAVSTLGCGGGGSGGSQDYKLGGSGNFVLASGKTASAPGGRGGNATGGAAPGGGGAGGDVRVTTEDGSLTVSGTISAAAGAAGTGGGGNVTAGGAGTTSTATGVSPISDW